MAWWGRPKVRAVGVGLRNGCIIVALTLANAAIQAFRHSHGSAARPLVAFSYLWAAASVFLVFLPGLLVVRRWGSLKLGLYTGAGIGVAPGIGVLVLTALWMSSHPAQYANSSDSVAYAVGTIIGYALVLAACIALGALLSLPGALVGRSQWRQQHPSLPSFVVEHTSESLAAALAAAPIDDQLNVGWSHAGLTIGSSVEAPPRATPLSAITEVTLYQSTWRGLLQVVVAVLLVVGSVVALVSPRASASTHVSGIVGVILFGLALLLFGFRLLLARPLLRATRAGIEYRGYRFPWSRRAVPWEQVGAIWLDKTTSRYFGRYELTLIVATSPHSVFRSFGFQGFALPNSARETLRTLATQFHDEIERNDVDIIGIQ